MAVVKNAYLIEKCLKTTIKDKQIYKSKELYEIEPLQIKKTIEDCFCKHVKAKDAEKIYEEMSNLLGLYSYVKNKKNIKPYIIVGNDL